MSFRCDFCNKPQKSGSSPVMIVTEKRQRVYEEVRDGNKLIDKGGVGWEIAKEKKACAKCIKRMKREAAKKREE